MNEASILVVLKKQPNLREFVEKCTSLNITNDLRILSAVDVNGGLTFFALNGASVTISDAFATSHLWQEDLIPGQYRILVVQESGIWKLYRIVISGNDLSAQIRSSWNCHDIGLQLESAENKWQTEILRFRENEGIFAVDNCEIIKVVLRDGFGPECKLSFRIASTEIRCIRYLSERVYTLLNDCICVYDMKDGTKCFHWNSIINNAEIFWISPDAKTILLSDGSDKLYFMRRPLCHASTAKANNRGCGKPIVSAFVKQLKERKRALLSDKQIVDHVSLDGANIRSVVMCSNHVLCLLECATYNQLKVVEIESGRVVTNERLGEKSALFASIDPSYLPLVLSDDQLMIVLIGNSPNRLVNELMVYTGGTVLHNLAHLNKWQDITVDFEVFDIGLRNRQLNTISFFLNGKLEEFHMFWQKLNDETMNTEMVQIFLKELTVVLGLLFNSIENHFVGLTTSLHFGEQLLRVALQTVIKLMTYFMIELPVPRFFPIKEFTHPNEILTQHLMTMRKYLVGRSLESVSTPEVLFASPVVEHWLSQALSAEDIVRDAVLRGCIMLAQWHLSIHHGKMSFDKIRDVGMSYSEHLLSEGRFEDTKAVMQNLDLDFNFELLKITRRTTKCDLRVLLISQISDLLSAEDREASKLLEYVEMLYPCFDFEAALQSRTSSEEGLSMSEMASSVHNSFNYCNLSLELVKTWDTEVQNLVLVPAFIQGKCFGDHLPVSTVWTYLLYRGDLSCLLSWVQIFYEQQVGTSFPRGWKIDLSMVNSIKGRTLQHIEDALLDEIAKYGIICEDELEDINLLLRRLGRAGCSLGTPFQQDGKSLSLEDFNHRIVHYCLEHNLLRFLYHFLSTSGRYLHCLPCPICHVPLLVSVLSFCHWLSKPDDEYLMLQAILSNGYLTQPLPKPTFQEICHLAPPLLVAATSLFICDLPANLECAFQQAPLLQDAFSATSHECSDVTMYHLLHGNAPLDPSRLFGWQTTNTLKTEDAPIVLPNFSLSSLVQKHGLYQELDFTYYLKEGRPNFAYLKFVAQELLSSSNLTTLRIKDACLETTLLAISNFQSPKISAACILFMEFLGQPSLSLRVDLQVASLLQAQQLTTPLDIALQLQSCQENASTAQKIAALLSTALLQLNRSDSAHILKSSDLHSWLLLVYFCQLHSIQVETSFLKVYARKDNWLAFLVLAQIFQISREQLLRLIPEFSSECLVEHLTHFLQTKHSKGRVETKAEVSRDLRSFLYTRIGVKKGSPTASPHIPGSVASADAFSDEDRISISSEEGFPPLIDEDDGKDNLFEFLFCAFKSESPADYLLNATCYRKNPVLALVAGSFTDATVVSCMCCWIVATVADESSPCGHSWTERDLERLLLELVSHNNYHHLLRVFSLFMPGSFLLHIVEFLHIFWIEKRYQASLAVLYGIKSEKILEEELWLQDLATKLLLASLSASSVVTYEAKIFVKHLASTEDLSTTDLPNFKKLNELLQCLGDANIELPIKDLLQPLGSDSFLNGTWKVVRELQEANLFHNASRFGQVAQLSRDQVLLSQLTVEALSKSTEEGRQKFWEHCDEIMCKENILPGNAATFFQEWCKKVESYQEKFFLMHLSFCWLKDTQCEMDMWNFCIKAETELKNAACLLEVMKYDCLHEWEYSTDPESWIPPHVYLATQSESLALSRLLNMLLDTGHFGQALRVSSIYQHPCIDMDIILTCLKLARQQIDVTDIDALFMKELDLERKLSPSKTTSGSSPVVGVMNQLYDIIVHGKPVCNKIIVHYSIAQFLEWTYDQVAKQQETLPLLENILIKINLEKYELAKKLIAVRAVRNMDVVLFLASKISQSLKVLLGMAAQCAVVDVQDFGFHLLLVLCEDPSILGNTILSDAQKEGDNLNEKELALIVEMYIRAHDCFTASSNTEGIARVLRKARKLTFPITETQNFNLMVRLLTGVGRYSEMTYIFDILHENSSFELLLKRGTEKLPLLRLALLNYLKQQHASNTEVHSMLALKFKMFREVAEILESSSIEKLESLKKDCGKQVLDIIAQDLGAAAKSYKQAGCFRHAQSCSRRASLVLLQGTLLPSGTWILGLDREAIKKFIVERKTFHEAYVVAEAYQENQAWDMALYVNVVQRANWNYLRDFRTHLGLTTAVIESVSKRFFSDAQSGYTQNMKKLLNFCIDVEAKYKLARQLGFDDVVQELLRGDAGAYLHDLAAQFLV